MDSFGERQNFQEFSWVGKVFSQQFCLDWNEMIFFGLKLFFFFWFSGFISSLTLENKNRKKSHELFIANLACVWLKRWSSQSHTHTHTRKQNKTVRGINRISIFFLWIEKNQEIFFIWNKYRINYTRSIIFKCQLVSYTHTHTHITTVMEQTNKQKTKAKQKSTNGTNRKKTY